MLNEAPLKIIDISQPITSATACFPGDTPFQKQVTVSFDASQVINLTAFTMSPHIGTHADSPIHIYGDLQHEEDTAGQMPLTPFIGKALVINIAPHAQEIQLEQVKPLLKKFMPLPPRILFKTQTQVRYDVFESEYAYFSTELIEYLTQQGVILMGLDTPSVDHIAAKQLKAHQALLNGKMAWLENLDLTPVDTGVYNLVALPLKFLELEASPVRAVLLA